jgi:3-phosphoshikimate 1-carboxyvinyltransferase
MKTDPPVRPVETLPSPSDARLVLPGSKSEANRVLVAAALSGQRVLVEGATPCDDVRHLVKGLAALGHEAVFEDVASGRVRVGPRRADGPTRGELYCGNAGTALRFLVSVAAITPGEWTLTGDEHMRRRPIEPLLEAWRALGADVASTDGCPPVRVVGGARRGGRTRLDASLSSQFLSSLLLVGPSLAEGLTIEFTGALASEEYAQLTLDVLSRFGAVSELAPGGARVRPGRNSVVEHTYVGGDWSAMGVWTCLDALTGSRVTAVNLRPNSGQADEALPGALALLDRDGDVVVDVARYPDQFINLAVCAARRSGTTRFTGGANLRIKECDRIAVTARELTRLGVDVRELPDGLEVRGAARLRPGVVDPESDHRVAMAFVLAGLLSPGISIADPDCVGKSYPTFWDDLERVRAAGRCVAVVGMRGAGKSTFARALAERSGRRLFDTDSVFEQRFGPIPAWVAAHGWEAFREQEAFLVEEALAPGNVAALGGGALGRGESRALVRERAVVFWLEASLELLRSRLAPDTTRPSVTGAAVLDELPALLDQRRPHFQALAHHVLPADAELDEQVERAVALLAAPCRFDRAVRPRSC